MLDSEKIGALIAALRQEKGMTQRQLAEQIGVGDKAVSKWERGQGLPDVSLLAPISDALEVSLDTLLQGAPLPKEEKEKTMKKTRFYVCPVCGGVTATTGHLTAACCGRTLAELTPQKAEGAERLQVEETEDDWYLTSSHPMEKDHYLSFVALLTGERLQLIRQYPEWELQVRIPKRGHGRLLWYCTRDGLFEMRL